MTSHFTHMTALEAVLTAFLPDAAIDRRLCTYLASSHSHPTAWQVATLRVLLNRGALLWAALDCNKHHLCITMSAYTYVACLSRGGQERRRIPCTGR